MSNQVQDHPSVKVIVVGVSSTGKTSLWEKLIQREDADFYFFFDHKDGDFSRRFNIAPCHSLEQCKTHLGERVPVIIYDPHKEFPGKVENAFCKWSEWIWSFRELKGRKIIGSDEIDSLIDPRNVPDDFLKIVGVGRTFQMDVFCIAQSMNALHNGVRKQFTEIFAFRQGDETGLPFLISKGFDGNELLNLQNGLWIYKHSETGKMERGGNAFTLKNSGRNLKGL
jgi:hypothetical protein